MLSLKDPVSKISGIGKLHELKLERLGIKNLLDLLNHFPFRYDDVGFEGDIESPSVGDKINVKAQILYIKNIYTRGGKVFQSGRISDGSSEIDVIWFNQPYLVKALKGNQLYSFSGKVGEWSGKKTLLSPVYERVGLDNKTFHTAGIIPIYPETSGINSKWLRKKIFELIDRIDEDGGMADYLSHETLQELKFYSLWDAIKKIHRPKKISEINKSKKRLSFDELLKLQLGSGLRRVSWHRNRVSHKIDICQNDIDEFSALFPFTLTTSQKKVISEISDDFHNDYPMNRILVGDVGSGKTVLAAYGIYVSFICGCQSVLMAPTQILAMQHYQTLKKFFEKIKIRIELVTSDSSFRDLGRTDLFIGTHALIHRATNFERAAFVAIDEQHRFGVEQRAHLTKRTSAGKFAPHILTMTATPIPRTVALAAYGDLDLSVLNDMPIGRQKIQTHVVSPRKREGAYEFIRKRVNEGDQCFIVCPLIEESSYDLLRQTKAVKSEYEKLKEIFPEHKLGLLHGRLTPAEKKKTLEDFSSGDIKILVSTPVIEVGIDITNATIMVIEAADRFGLAQLHQLRGRVGRGDKKSYCFLFTDNSSPKVSSRLLYLTKVHSGQKLAEIDLELRGPGELFGIRQSGLTELKIANWRDFESIKKARDFASRVIANPGQYKQALRYFGYEKIAAN